MQTEYRPVLGGRDDLVQTVGFRDLSGRLLCIAGIGADLWVRLQSDKQPKELHRFANLGFRRGRTSCRPMRT
jgi:putative iron-dependent peroxidase